MVCALMLGLGTTLPVSHLSHSTRQLGMHGSAALRHSSILIMASSHLPLYLQGGAGSPAGEAGYQCS